MKRLVISIGLFFCVSALRAATLSTSFVDVVVLDVPLGVPHTVQDAQGHGILIRNTGTSALPVSLRVVVPTLDELKGGAKPIPDPSWIRILPLERLIPPNEEVECKIVLEIPKEKKYRNQIYQAMVWIQSGATGDGGVLVRAGLKSRVRFRTRPR